MASKTATEQGISIELNELRNEVSRLRSAIIGMVGEDKGGEYNPVFVRKVLKVSRESSPHLFKNRESFLDHLNRLS